MAFQLPVFAQNSTKPIPHLEKRGMATQLIVDGKPYLVLGGELHNASTSSLDYLEPRLSKLAAMNLNTVLAAVTWDLLEPQEGKFDFTLVDGLLKQARKNKLRVVLLWFGSWKNGLSHYTPDWVKADFKRFPRVKLASGKSIESVTPFSDKALQADTRAYTALMQHIRAVDSKERTVIMIQMENEVGVLGDSRDWSAIANAALAAPVPAELLASMQKNKEELQPFLEQLWEAEGSKTTGTWREVFGRSLAADEIFMAWQYARYMNAITAAGKAEYPLPVYVNAWIIQPEDKLPGDYPSGGPQSQLHDVWRAAAPRIDILAPDIYLPDFKSITAMYHHSWNPLFIPESFADTAGSANIYYAIGHENAIGYSPFGIDGERAPVDPLKAILPRTYKLLSGMAPVLLDAQAKGTMTAVILDKTNPSQKITTGGYDIEINLRRTRYGTSTLTTGYGIIISSGPDAFILSGLNLDFTFKPATPGPPMAGLASVWEGVYSNGQWKPGRKLNGDNIMLNYVLWEEAPKNQTGSVARFEGGEPVILKVKLYRFE
ncbi:MAG TPA: DUF5597 domain-containing protein [Chitinophagaceae bacterium]